MDKELDIIIQLQNTSGTNNKLDLLRNNIDNERLKNMLYYTYNPFYVFGISTKKLNRNVNIPYNIIFDDILQLLEYLKINKTGTDQIIANIQHFLLSQEPKYFDTLKDIICKSLTLGVNIKSINKIWTDLIPDYEVQQGERLDQNIDNVIDNNYSVIVTQKFDGQRCSARVENGNVTLYSRNGKPYEGLHELEKELSLLPNGMYDGELLLNAPQSNTSITNFSNYIYHPMPSKELFKKTASIVNSDDDNKTNINLWLYDYTPLENFDTMKTYNVPVEQRKQYIDSVVSKLPNTQHLRKVIILYQGPFDYNKIQNMLDEVIQLQQEGLMINIVGSPYEFNRSRNMLKVKKMYPVDLEVIRIEEGSGINKGKVGSLVVNYKGYEVKVGSGLTKEDREKWWNNPNLILGKIITVQYFEETTNKKDDSKSLRFPVFKEIRNDKDTESYN